ncbi:efflux RND transporter permease subunit [Burkholderia cenocepacia]|uniref:efflux RND transporter permease subunit n=1 Tax=Burkholderia cenocepacia TaxID=95486 RepID=UPI002ABD3387|nr:efflux RND transporter permease subunit [Burkholderia cenocepacia]
MLEKNVTHLGRLLFERRKSVIAIFLIITVIMGYSGLKLRMEAGYEKQIPTDHPYVRAMRQYADSLIAPNRITIVLRVKNGSIWTVGALQKLYEVTQAVTYLPHVDRQGVQSLWTPNVFVNEITVEGFRADPLIPGTVTSKTLSEGDVKSVRRSAEAGGFIGKLVDAQGDAAMITADLIETDRSGKKVDYLEFNRELESQLRSKFEDEKYEIKIIGFAKQIGDIADGASNVLVFSLIAILMTIVAVYWYSRSIILTLLPIACSLTSLIWQFGFLHLLGFGLDPLAVLVPFLVFAIGVSHGVQQINTIVRVVSRGAPIAYAAQSSFASLLIPGILSLLTAFVSFITLTLIPIPMVQELGVTAAIGVAFKIFTNLIMLPVLASFVSIDRRYCERMSYLTERRSRWIVPLTYITKPQYAAVVLFTSVILCALAGWFAKDRVVGTLEPGAPELKASSRFNQDSQWIGKNFDAGLDWLSIMVTSAGNACGNPVAGLVGDDLSFHLKSVPGVISVDSYARKLREFNAGYNEGYPKMALIPIDIGNYASLSMEIGRERGFSNKDCSMTAIHVYLSDHKAATIHGVIDAVKKYQGSHNIPGVEVRLAAGNAGVLAATDEELEQTEIPMMAYVYAAIIVLVLFAYRDWRAVLSCCLPLTAGTFVGYWFMDLVGIGLTVATLPVMVLSVGIGVDYAFYIYNRLQLHLSGGMAIEKAVCQSLVEVGIATVFTAITLAVGVATWIFSGLKFQADMGKLLSFMFLVNLVMAMTALPALAVLLEKMVPRRSPARANGFLEH